MSHTTLPRERPARSALWLASLLVAAALLSLALLAAPARPVQAQSTPQPGDVIIYFFWGDGCPHCAAAKPYLESLKQANPRIQVRAYEVWKNEENYALMGKMLKALNQEPKAVPTIIMGWRTWVGFSDEIKAQMDDEAAFCLKSGCFDAGTGVLDANPRPALQTSNRATSTVAKTDVIQVPLIGEIDLDKQPLIIATLLISFVDGVNPCSVWVLTMLLALTLHTGSRRKVVLIGLIFLTVTAGVYALFIAGLFTVLSLVSFVGWIQVVVAVVALFFGLVNIKDYFWYKEGISFTISDEVKPGIFQRVRKLMDASQSFWGLVTGTVVLSGGVSLVEFSCTAGFPVMWTNMLSAQKVDALTFILLLILYMFIYQLDEMAIFFTAVFTLKASRLEEKQGRILKLIGGVLMITLAGVMIVNPALMNNLSSSLIIFGIAFVVTALILVLHRRVLPAMGIWIGTERRTKK